MITHYLEIAFDCRCQNLRPRADNKFMHAKYVPLTLNSEITEFIASLQRCVHV